MKCSDYNIQDCAACRSYPNCCCDIAYIRQIFTYNKNYIQALKSFAYNHMTSDDGLRMKRLEIALSSNPNLLYKIKIYLLLK